MRNKHLILLAFMLVSMACNAQKKTILTDVIKATTEFWLNGQKITLILTDTSLAGATNNQLATAQAIKAYVQNHSGGGGGGGSDNWGSQVVQHGSTLTGTGVTGNLLDVANNGIGNAQMADNAIGNAEMADNAVASAEIANGSVTLADMANVATGSVFYRKTASTGVPEVQTLATLKTDLGLTGTNSGDVTLAGQNYLSIAGQVITANAVDLSGTNVTGISPVSRGGSGAGSLTGYVKGNGTSAFTASSLVPEGDISNGTVLARLADNELISGAWTFTNSSNRFRDNAFTLSDDVDNTKLALFQTSSIATGTSRTYTLQNKNHTIAATDDAAGGDASGTLSALTVAKIQGKSIPVPGVGDDLKFVQYNNTSGQFQYSTGGGGSDNWGSQVVEHDATLSGTGVTGNLLSLADNAVTNAKMADNAIGTAEITDGTVALADMANVATGSVFYRKTASTGVPEVQTLATLKTDLGLTGTNSGDVTLAGQNYLSIAGQVITANAVDLSGTNVTGTLAAARAGALTGDVTSSAGSYSTSIATNAVTNAKMADNAVGTAEIADGTVALSDMANVATGSVFYRKTASTGVPEVQTLATLKTDLGLTGTNSGDQTITLTGDVTGSGNGSFAATIADNSVDGTDIALGSDAQGDIMYYDGTNWVRKAKGFDGQFLSQASSVPTWVNAPTDGNGIFTADGTIPDGVDAKLTADGLFSFDWSDNTDAIIINDLTSQMLITGDDGDAKLTLEDASLKLEFATKGLQIDATKIVLNGLPVGIGGNPSASSAFQVTSTTGFITPPLMSETQRDLVSAGDGNWFYNTTTSKHNFRQNGAWVELGSGGGGGGGALSAITAATATNTIDNLNFAQTWNWSTASTHNPFTYNANALTSGSIFTLSTSSNSLNSTNGLLNMVNTGSSSSGMFARFKANTTAGGGMFLLANGRLGVGTDAPGTSLVVSNNNTVSSPPANALIQAVGGSSTPTMILSDAHNGGTGGAIFQGRHARGSTTSPTQVLSGDILSEFTGAGYHSGSAFSNAVAFMRTRANQDFTNAAQGTNIGFYTTPDGSTTPAERLIVRADGGVSLPGITNSGALYTDGNGTITNSKVTVTVPATAATLTLANNSTLATSGAFSTTLTATATTAVTLPTTGTLSTLAGAETLTNKTMALGSNTITGTTAQFNTANTDGDFATLAGTETLTNKTLALGSNTVSGTTAQFNTALTDNDFTTQAGAEVITNKEILPRVSTVASSSTPTPVESTDDFFTVTALAANATFGSPGAGQNGQTLTIRILDNGTSRTLAWNAIYRAGTAIPLPTATTISKTIYLTFIYNTASSTWDLVGRVTDL